MVSNTRLYGAAIAFVSGLYSLGNATGASRLGTSGVIMALVGVIVVLHGAILLTEYADRLGSASGPLMILYAAVMLANQALLGTGMIDGPTDMGMGSSVMTTGMGWDAGMVALAVLMLVSGVIMTGGRMGDGGKYDM